MSAYDVYASIGDIEEIEFGDEDSRRCVRAGLDVLCWVLKREDNDNFADNLRLLDQAAEEVGFVLTPILPVAQSPPNMSVN